MLLGIAGIIWFERAIRMKSCSRVRVDVKKNRYNINLHVGTTSDARISASEPRRNHVGNFARERYHINLHVGTTSAATSICTSMNSPEKHTQERTTLDATHDSTNTLDRQTSRNHLESPLHFVVQTPTSTQIFITPSRHPPNRPPHNSSFVPLPLVDSGILYKLARHPLLTPDRL